MEPREAPSLAGARDWREWDAARDWRAFGRAAEEGIGIPDPDWVLASVRRRESAISFNETCLLFR